MNAETHQANAGIVDRAQRATRPANSSAMLASCVCAILAGGSVQALELGEPVVRSTLGERLDVTVPYRVTGNERLTAECVSLVRGEAAGIPALTRGRVTSTSGNRLTVRSSQPVTEPLLGLNVKVDCPATPFIVRSYMLMLDPPGRTPVPETPAPRSAATAPVAIPRAVTNPAPRNPATPPQRRSAARSTPVQQNATYRVQSGDTLSTIAQRIPDRADTIWVTAERIFAANPEAFIDGDMDRLMAGSLLVIPDLSLPGEPAIAPPLNAQAGDQASATTPATAPAAVSAPEPVTAASPTAGAPASAIAIPPAAQPEPAAESAAETVTAPVETALGPALTTTTDTTAEGVAEESAWPEAEIAGAADPFKTDLEASATAGPFAAEVAGETAPPAAATAPTTEAAAGDGEQGVSPLFAALVGAGIGLLLGFLIFRGSLRELFRRAPAPARSILDDEETDTQPTPAVAEPAPKKHDEVVVTSVTAAPAVAVETEIGDDDQDEDAVIVAETDWDSVSHSRLKSLDLEVEESPQPAAVDEDGSVFMSEAAAEGEHTEWFEPFHGADPATEETSESMIVEVDTGAELSADTTVTEPPTETTDESTGLATAIDLEMLEEDYEKEFTATQRLSRQLADAALQLDDELSAHETQFNEIFDPEAVGALEDDVQDEGEDTLLAEFDMTGAHDEEADSIEDDDATLVASVEMSDGEDREDSGEQDDSLTLRLPEAELLGLEDDEASDDEEATSVVQLSEKRRA